MKFGEAQVSEAHHIYPIDWLGLAGIGDCSVHYHVHHWAVSQPGVSLPSRQEGLEQTEQEQEQDDHSPHQPGDSRSYGMRCFCDDKLVLKLRSD